MRRITLFLALLVLAVPLVQAATHTFSRGLVGTAGALEVTIPLDGSQGEGNLNADRNASTNFGHYASGTCTVTQTGIVILAPFQATCGVDRDDDGRVTNVDLSTTLLGHANTGSVDADGYDDDLASATGTRRVVVPLCLRADVNGAVTADFAEWDDLTVRIDASGMPPPAAGFFDVDVTLTTVTDSSCIPSAHTSSGWS